MNWIAQLRKEYSGFNYEIFGNTIIEYTIALLSVFLVVIAIRTVRHFCLPKIQAFTQRTKNEWDDSLVGIAELFFARGFAYFAGFVVSVQVLLTMPEVVDQILRDALLVWLAFKVGLAFSTAIDFVVQKQFSLEERTRFNSGLITFIATVGKCVLWALIAVTVLSNMGLNVIGFITGLGVVGLVLPIALKDTFSDLFATVSIHADKPFIVGDVIQLGDDLGTVERLGLKTTHLRSPDGHIVIVPNTALTASRLINYGRMNSRRVLARITIDGSTPNDTIREIVSDIKKIISSEEHVIFDRADAIGLSTYGFDIEWLYRLNDSDYQKLLTAQANINLKIKAMLEEKGVAIPRPPHLMP